MNKLKLTYPVEATPLNLDEASHLIPDYITTQKELNILEQKNILEGMIWAEKQKKVNVLSITFTYKLHKQMFNQVWKWAGIPRKTDKNIGVPWFQIPTQLNNLFKNTKYWIENKTYKWMELAARFHHKLVLIHPFPNGNGRYARLMTDILCKSHNQPLPSWGEKKSSVVFENENRTTYISALKKADKGDFTNLITFMKS